MTLSYAATNVYNILKPRGGGFIYIGYLIIDLWFGAMVGALAWGRIGVCGTSSNLEVRLAKQINVNYESYGKILIATGLLFKSSNDAFANTIDPILIMYAVVIGATKKQRPFRRLYLAICMAVTMVLFILDTTDFNNMARREAYNLAAQSLFVSYVFTVLDTAFTLPMHDLFDGWIKRHIKPVTPAKITNS